MKTEIQQSTHQCLETLLQALETIVRIEQRTLAQSEHTILHGYRRDLARTFQALNRLVIAHPSNSSPLEYVGLTTKEAARRYIGWSGQPLRAREIVEGLEARGWRSRPSRTPVATLVADLEKANCHFEQCEDGRWGLTDAAEEFELARQIVEAARHRYPHTASLLREEGGRLGQRKPKRALGKSRRWQLEE